MKNGVMRVSLLFTFFVLFVATLKGVTGDEYDHKYASGDPIKLWVNKVGPYNNPQETYNYYELPFCKVEPKDGASKKPVHKWGGLGEILEGNELILSNVEFKFRQDLPKRVMCSTGKLTEKEVEKFSNAIRNHYWYEFYMDELPIWGFVGEYVDPNANDDDEEDEEDNSSSNNKKSSSSSSNSGNDAGGDAKVYVYTHRSFDIGYNEDRIIQVNLTAERPKALKTGEKLDFTYSVNWEPTTTKFTQRFERYLDYNFFEHQIHWFSIFNSFMMVIFLAGLVSMILMRTLRNDYAKYAREEDDLDSMERDVNEESGWKLVHGDVFRPPKMLPVLAALIGTGTQLALLSVMVIGVTIAGLLFEQRGAITTSFIVCYALTSFISGYVAGGFNARNEGKNWIRTMLLTATLFPGCVFSIAFLLNAIAIYYHSLAAAPFGTMVVLALMWAFVSFPLVLFGTVIGRNWNGVPNNPCRVKTIPRPIPEKAWYCSPGVIGVVGGLLPFGSIFIETYFVFTSIWNYKVYYVYGFFLLVFMILMIVTLCVTVVGTYFLLNAENYHWHWTSFISAASTAFYVYVYSIYYFIFKTKMTGFFQTCFYFGYTAMFCLGLGLMCGAVGYFGANAFVRRIYRNIKCD